VGKASRGGYPGRPGKPSPGRLKRGKICTRAGRRLPARAKRIRVTRGKRRTVSLSGTTILRETLRGKKKSCKKSWAWRVLPPRGGEVRCIQAEGEGMGGRERLFEKGESQGLGGEFFLPRGVRDVLKVYSGGGELWQVGGGGKGGSSPHQEKGTSVLSNTQQHN